jgi:hypothetical protein
MAARNLTALAVLVLSSTIFGQEVENFRLEVSLSAWLINTSGTIQSGIIPVDLRRDLAIDRWQPHFFGRLVVKPARRHRLMVEGIPYRLNGAATITRQITFAGRTYNIQDFVTSAADIDYVAGAYQFDVLSRPQGHLGLLAGAGYVNASGTLTSRGFGFQGTEHQSFPFPQAGVEGRAFLLRQRRLLEIDGELKGMPLASYGHFLQFAAHGGIGLGRYVTLQAGYMLFNADVHRHDNTRGFTPTFQGPIFGLQFRDR